MIAKGYYTITRNEWLCFHCAVKRVIEKGEKPYLETTDYDYCQYTDCNTFIEDKVIL